MKIQFKLALLAALIGTGLAGYWFGAAGEAPAPASRVSGRYFIGTTR
jgi:membrane fusion protein, copper/silver efflux system